MKSSKIGVTLKQSTRSCGINCPPKTIVLVRKPSVREVKRKPRCLKLKYKNEYKRKLIHLKFMKLTSMRDNVFCPL